MLYRQDIEHCLAAKAFGETLAKTEAVLEKLRRGFADGEFAFLHLSDDGAGGKVARATAERYREEFSDVVIIGTGGSSLGARAITALARPGDGPRLHFAENIDSDGFERLFAAIDPAATGFLVISKSGATAETLALFFAAAARVRGALGAAALRPRFTLITEDRNNPLRRAGAELGLEMIAHDADISGRFSAFSVTGMLPAMIAGLDGEKFRDGAGELVGALTGGATAAAEFAPAIGAAVNHALAGQGITATVIMPYVDRLAEFGLWFRQLWAESLGKNGTGTTPIRARGTVDQHSQLQLYLDGPKDKMFTLIFGPAAGGGDEIPADLARDPELSYLAGRRMGDLLEAEQRATAAALAAKGLPVRVIRLDRVDEAALGQLMMHFMLETVIAADLSGVNAFDQPAVEDAKARVRHNLEDPPNEDKR